MKRKPAVIRARNRLNPLRCSEASKSFTSRAVLPFLVAPLNVIIQRPQRPAQVCLVSKDRASLNAFLDAQVELQVGIQTGRKFTSLSFCVGVRKRK